MMEERLHPVRSVEKLTFGARSPRKRPEGFRELREAFKEAIYAFHADRFPTRTSLFKVHEGFPIIYVAEGIGGFMRESREIVKDEGLKNLYFREVWNNEQEPEFCGTPWGIVDLFYGRWREMASDASVYGRCPFSPAVRHPRRICLSGSLATQHDDCR